ncbi:MAG: GGDEF domain-containing protein [Gammaproteobacteria bacterium]|nr:GGDEF domain-containing protein [Gammaproteobacteria bacterium]MDH5801264.1 GGDEF domain-containing protein [Gammaproteobacteria bacterium]
MSTLPQVTENKVLPVNSSGKLAAINNAEQLAENSKQYEKVLHIAGILQTSLNIEELLSQFSKELGDIVPHNNISYVYEKLSVNFTLGRRARHSCTYELSINEQHLGFLSLTRNSKFSNKEIETIEQLICAVHYPLRNAILYKDAVNAANKDPLTGIGNRSAMNTSVQREIELASRHNRSLGIIMMDVDHFKTINDTYGHSAGDLCLQSLVECTEKSVRISDMIFRYGGEEFVIVLPETDIQGVLRLAKRIRRRVERLQTQVNKQQISMTVSLGITVLAETDDDKSLFARADEALYKAKREGRNCIRIATGV